MSTTAANRSAWAAARAALSTAPAATEAGQAPEPVAQLIAEIRAECIGQDVWYAMNAEESGYSMWWDTEHEGLRWFEENPNASRGYHMVKRRDFHPAETLALRAADALRPTSRSH